MPEITTYYLGRVIKLGHLTSEMVVEAIINPEPIVYRGNSWSFFDANLYESRGVKFVYAKLSKFNPEGEVVIANTETRQEVRQAEPNLRIASSVFIYIPEVSGIAYTRIYNHIDERIFINRFGHIVQTKYDDFFVQCDIKPISDLRTFADKLMSLESICGIAANVNPPNPLFGPLWQPLKEYIAQRRSDKMIIREDASGDGVLDTNLPIHVKCVAEQTREHPYIPDTQLPIGDEAILMAADGYGSGIVKGRIQSKTITIKTSETVKNFEFGRDPDPLELFDVTYEIFKKIEEDRHMEH